jgi:hypothetical protein
LAIGVFDAKCGAYIISTLFKCLLIKVETRGLVPAAVQLPALLKNALIVSVFLLLFLSCVLDLIVMQCLFTNNVLESSNSI